MSMFEWTLQSKTPQQSTWICGVGYVHDAAGEVTWGLWGRNRIWKADTIDKAKEAVEEAAEPNQHTMMERAITGEWGQCVTCGEQRLGTPQEEFQGRKIHQGGTVLCLRCQNTHKRPLRLR